jgi:CRP/FNR family cyclic AMP-dependent transcriptional regulator
VAKPKLDAILALVPLFEGLSKRQLKDLANLAELGEYQQGHSVVRQGEPGDSFFVVLAGEATVRVKGKVVHRLLPSDHFGEISLLDGRERTASVVTETPMTLLILNRPAFLRAVEKDPALVMALLENLARMIRRVDRSLDR